MTSFPSYSLNINGKLWNLDVPQVMGILNITPDSFYADSRKQSAQDIRSRVRQILDEGASIIDVGAYSSRPGAEEVTEQEEISRLNLALGTLREEAADAIVSVDTFRANVAKHCAEHFGIQMINDISGGELDPMMFHTVAELGLPYILMHMKGAPKHMQEQTQYTDFMCDIMTYFGEKVTKLHEMGVADIIVDPGFGFAKTTMQNYELMDKMENLHLLECPLLVGISRKSMIYKVLNTTPSEALNGTTMLNTVALMKGAHILRVHDVKEAVETVRLFCALKFSVPEKESPSIHV